jgi:hypothetical protein
MAAGLLCFKCYRREARHQVMAGLDDLGVSKPLVLKILRLIGPYRDLVAEYLALPDVDRGREHVNGEQTDTGMFTVHANPSQPRAAIEKRLEQDPRSDNEL